MTKRDQPEQRIPQDFKSKFNQPFLYVGAHRTHSPLLGFVSFNAQIIHHSPCRCNRAAGTCARKGGGYHPPARPIIAIKDHMGLQVCIFEENRRRSLGCIAIFVQVSRNGMHSGDFKIKGGYRHTVHTSEGGKISAHARINMQPEVMFLSDFRKLFNGVNDPVRKVRSRAHKHHRVIINCSVHCRRISHVGFFIDRHTAQFDFQHFAGFSEGWVTRARQH